MILPRHKWCNKCWRDNQLVAVKKNRRCTDCKEVCGQYRCTKCKEKKPIQGWQRGVVCGCCGDNRLGKIAIRRYYDYKSYGYNSDVGIAMNLMSKPKDMKAIKEQVIMCPNCIESQRNSGVCSHNISLDLKINTGFGAGILGSRARQQVVKMAYYFQKVACHDVDGTMIDGDKCQTCKILGEIK